MTPQMPTLKPISKYNKKFESEAIVFSPKLHGLQMIEKPQP